MKNGDIMQLLLEAMKKFGELAVADSDFEKDSACECFDAQNVDLKRIRGTLLAIGDVLEEDLENQAYVVVLPVGFANGSRALAVVKLDGTSIRVAAHSKEGLIRQNNAKKAIEKIKAGLFAE